MQNIKIAFCIPTYTHPDMIAEFLEEYAMGYVERGIDIYIYDSSPDDKTEIKVILYQKQIHSLHYIRLPEKLHACEKLYLILQQYGMTHRYDFIWPCGDGIRYPLEAIDIICPQISLQYDVVHINAMDRENLGDRIYKDSNEYFVDCAWHSTLLGAVLLNCHTMLKNVCWREYETKFLKDGYFEFSQVSFYFHRFLELPHFCIKHISGSTLCYNSKLKKRSTWYNRFFEVLCVDWINTIDGLPAVYTNKDNVLIKFGKYAALSASESVLQKQIDGIFNKQIFEQYKNILPRICDIPLETFRKIAFMTPEQAIDEQKKHIEEWCTDLMYLLAQNGEILIYGAGTIARRYAKFFETENIPLSGFLISVKKENENLLMGYPVYDVEELVAKKRNYGICLGLSIEHHRQVKKTLIENGMSEQMYFNEEMNEYILSTYTL